MLVHLLILAMVGGPTLAQYIYVDKEGYTRSSSAWSIPVSANPWLMETPNHPSPSPKAKMSWKFMVTAPKGMKPALRIDCNDIRLPETDSCNDFSLSIADGKPNQAEVKKVCGNLNEFSYISKTADVLVVLIAEQPDKAYMSCIAKGILLDDEGNEIVGATVMPMPTKPPYMTEASKEIDSSEDGVSPGEKSTSCKCGWANKAVRARVVNGRETEVNEFPFMALLVQKGFRFGGFCGGTIISALHVLTAAHCVQPRLKQGISVVVGLHHTLNWKISNGTEMVGVKEMIVHKDYNNVTFVNDISLLFLEKRLVFHPTVGPACLPTSRLDLVGEYVKTIGWGATVHKGFMMQELRKGNLRALSLETCYKYGSRNVDLGNPHQFCVYAKKKSFCMGDSGGPIVWLDPDTNRFTLVALPSFVIYCGDQYPAVATDVSAFLPWIQDKMKETTNAAKLCVKV